MSYHLQLRNITAQMDVIGALVGKIYFAIVSALLAVVLLAAAASSHDDVPGIRRGIELELFRTYSFAIVRDLQSPDSTSATRAALVLGRTKDKRALAPLLARYRSAINPGVRAMSIYGIGLLCDARVCLAAPIAAALHDPSSAVRAAGVDAAQRAIAARQAGSGGFLHPLATRMVDDSDSVVRSRAAVALAAYAPRSDRPAPNGPGAGAAVAAAFARETDRTVRWHEAWALGRAFPFAPSGAQVRAALRDRDELVRMAFVDVVAKRRDPRLAALIAPLRNDRSWRVAEEAREGLRRLAGAGRTAHWRVIPAGVLTPPPVVAGTAPALPRPRDLGPPRRPPAAAAVAISRLALRVTDAASLDGPVAGPHPRVRIGTTQGPIVVRLYPEWAPLTVANFLGLVDRGYYDGLRWFRIVPNFVAQTGDPRDDGEGDAGYTIPAEENPLEQRAGVISMGLNYANDAPIRDSAGTQFYLTMSPQFHLNRSFTVFGEIESGFSVLGRLIESDRMTRVEQLPAR